MNPVERLVTVLLALMFFVIGLRDVTRRRRPQDGTSVPMVGFFSLFGGVALLVAAWSMEPSTGLIGGVMIVMAGIAAAVDAFGKGD